MKKISYLAVIAILTMIVACKNKENKSAGKTSPKSDSAMIINGAVIDENIPAYKIVSMSSNTSFRMIELSTPTDTLDLTASVDIIQNADLFEGNIVRIEFDKQNKTSKTVSYIENYDFNYTKFLKTVSGKWISLSDDTIILRANGSMYSNIKKKQFKYWNIIEQPAMTEKNKIVMKLSLSENNTPKEVSDTAIINMDRKYLTIPGTEIALKYKGR
jgi:hypothetical protein